VSRLRRALDLLGVEDAESIVNRCRQPNATGTDPIDLDVGSLSFGDVFEMPAVDRPPAVEPRIVERDEEPAPSSPADEQADAPLELLEEPGDEAIVLDALEIDLSETLAGLGAASPMLPPPPVAASEDPVPAPQDLESVFEEMRVRATREQQTVDAGEQYERGLQHLEEGRVAEALADLQGAARTPLFRFRAAARLGRLYVARGDFQEGIDWLERAAEAPAPSPDEGQSVLYDLAGALERTGESARALAILMELDADGGAYRDVRERVEQLTRAQTGSRGA
jgi:tetratricopeptide (TPR) repeat protein